jgi:hypothetical protein
MLMARNEEDKGYMSEADQLSRNHTGDILLSNLLTKVATPYEGDVKVVFHLLFMLMFLIDAERHHSLDIGKLRKFVEKMHMIGLNRAAAAGVLG